MNNQNNAGLRRNEEEHMGLSPLALDVIMAVIGISIPVLIYVGCIMTRKRNKPPELPVVAPRFELDRAA
jgi:hypothetical protein